MTFSVCGKERLAVLGRGPEREGAEGQVVRSEFCLEQEDKKVHEMMPATLENNFIHTDDSIALVFSGKINLCKNIRISEESHMVDGFFWHCCLVLCGKEGR